VRLTLRKTGPTRENADNMANNTDVAIVILAAGRRPLVEHVGAQSRDIKTALTRRWCANTALKTASAPYSENE
jgi:hypothetical protein